MIINEIEIATLHVRLAEATEKLKQLESAPLCANHADGWYCSRDQIKTTSGCVLCDLQTALAAKTAECERLLKLETLVKEGRSAFNDLNPSGKTIIDFLNLWLDQANERATKAEAERDKVKAQLTEAQVKLAKAQDALRSARGFIEWVNRQPLDQLEDGTPGNYLSLRHTLAINKTLAEIGDTI